GGIFVRAANPFAIASRGVSRYVGISSKHRIGHSASGVFASTHYHLRRERKGRRSMSFVRPCLPQPALQLYPAPNGLARGRPDGEHSVAGATVSLQKSGLSPPRVCRTFSPIGPSPCASHRTAGKLADPNRCSLGR